MSTSEEKSISIASAKLVALGPYDHAWQERSCTVKLHKLTIPVTRFNQIAKYHKKDCKKVSVNGNKVDLNVPLDFEWDSSSWLVWLDLNEMQYSSTCEWEASACLWVTRTCTMCILCLCEMEWKCEGDTFFSNPQRTPTLVAVFGFEVSKLFNWDKCFRTTVTKKVYIISDSRLPTVVLFYKTGLRSEKQL